MLRGSCLAVVGPVLMVLVAGCSKSGDLPQVAPVSGKVTLRGKPLAKALVLLESAKGRTAAGITDQDGHYELQFTGPSGNTKGAEIGDNTVRITTVLDGPTPAGYKDPIPAKYNESSQLKVTVQTGANTHDFALD